MLVSRRVSLPERQPSVSDAAELSFRRILEGTEKRVPDCSGHVGDHPPAGRFKIGPLLTSVTR